VTQLENILNHSQFRACSIETSKSRPVVHNQTPTDWIRATINSSSLNENKIHEEEPAAN
jgi:hypothetical protein